MGRRDVGLVVVVLLALSAASAMGQDQLDHARLLMVEGRYPQARRLARGLLRTPVSPQHRQEALAIVVGASCALGDEATARRSFAALPSRLQGAAERFCRAKGIDLLPDLRRPWRIAALSTLGASLASGLAAIVLAQQVWSARRDVETATGDYRGETHDPYWGSATDDICQLAGEDGAGAVVQACDRGRRYSIASNVMIGVTVAGLAASGYLFYRGWFGERAKDPPLQLAPTVFRSGGGLVLELRH